MELRRFLGRVWLLFFFLACSSGNAPLTSAAELRPTVILVSLDGTRPADVNERNLPSLVALAARGARAERLIPPLPANTFPSHVSLVTGVSPARHGIVNNGFRDPEKGIFEKQDAAGWLEAEPLWSILEGHGIATAAYHWVGSEGAPAGGRAPRHWRPFSKRTRESAKVEQILAWLDLPESEGRPHFVATWFRGADHAGHETGPGSEDVHEALLAQDPAIAALVRGLEERGLFASTTLLFVSDHGMLRAQRRIDLGARLWEQGIRARVFGIGGFASIDFGEQATREPGLPQRVIALCRDLGLQAELAGIAGSDFGHVRFGDVVVRAPLDTAIVYKGLAVEGFHGHDPEAPEMGAFFIGYGRGVVPGSVLPAVRAIDVAPTVLTLLGVAVPDSMQGRAIAGLAPPAPAEQP